ncbi:MAG: TolC family protein, partial [Anaerotignum sp.]|nr:TolC family protein [Anaerotignum sp.]
ALTLAMSLFCPQVFAAEALSAEEQGVKPVSLAPVEEALPQLTVEEALDKAKKHDPELRNIEDALELVVERVEDFDDKVGSVSLPNYDFERWTESDALYQMYYGVLMMEQGEKQAKIGKSLQNLVLETTVRTYFTTILSIEDGLELAKESAEMQQKTYMQGYTKYRLGMLSKYNLDQLEITAQKAKNSVITTEATLEQMYISLNDLIGENPEKRFELVYDTSFVPYEMSKSMDQYIKGAMEDDLMIQMQELTTELAKFQANYRPLSNDSQTSLEDDRLAYTKADRALKKAKSDKETLIRNTYLKIKALETEYASAQADLKKAQADYRVAQLSYQAGMATKMAVEGAAMGIAAAETALNALVYEHDMLVYSFENPSLLSNSMQAQK